MSRMIVIKCENDNKKRIKAKFDLQNGNENVNSKPDWISVNAKNAKYSFNEKLNPFSFLESFRLQPRFL